MQYMYIFWGLFEVNKIQIVQFTEACADFIYTIICSRNDLMFMNRTVGSVLSFLNIYL